MNHTPKEKASKIEATLKLIHEVGASGSDDYSRNLGLIHINRTKNSRDQPRGRFIELDFSGERPQPENLNEWITTKLKANGIDPDSNLGRIIGQDLERSYKVKYSA